MNRKNYNQRTLYLAKRIICINHLGGKCKMCNNDNIFHLCFHHIDSNLKEFDISDIKNVRLSKVKDELDKCILLCENCHRELHYNNSNPLDITRRNDKNIFLEYKDCKCQECGYDKCESALTFHHRNKNEKEFNIGSLSLRIESISDLNNNIKNELDKCDILCANCHRIKHVDIEFFNTYKDEIYNKVENYKEVNPKLNRSMVFELHKNGLTNKKISDIMNCSKSVISDILRNRVYKKR